MARRTLFITYFATYLLAISAIFLIVFGYYRADEFPPIALFSGLYLVLLLAEPFFIRQNRIRTYVYLIAQIAMICGLAPIIPNWDYWALLFYPLVVQAMVNFESRTGYFLTGILTAISAYLFFLVYDSAWGLAKIPVFGSVNVLIAALIAISREAVAARDESQKQQAELQLAHQQLQDYTERAEELAVLQERSRLARELHDAVTQTLFSASLIAQALPDSWKRDQTEGQKLLKELEQLNRGALAEMRTLLLELRPAALIETRLDDLLHQLSEAVTGREGIPVTTMVEGECVLPPNVHVAVYRIAQEALNNVVKHARADQASVSLRCTSMPPALAGGERQQMRVELIVEDDGRGFDQARVPLDHLGLGIMRERAQSVGAALEIDSAPGSGTRITMIWLAEKGRG